MKPLVKSFVKFFCTPRRLVLPSLLAALVVPCAAQSLGGPVVAPPTEIVKPSKVETKVETKKEKPRTLAQASGLLGGATGATPETALGGTAVPKVGIANGEGHDVSETEPEQPPVDLAQIRRLKIGGADVPEAPMLVGQLDILAPISTQLERLSTTVTRVAPENMPGNPNAATDDSYFQINPPGGTPIVMMIGRRVAYINKAEQPLKAAPLVIKDKIWLPVFSIAPLLGAAPRLSPDGTLFVNPTIQSVELFLVKGVPALTVKTSAPLPDGGPLNGGPQIGTLENPDRIYIDFPGYALGLDAANTPTLRVVAPGLSGVAQVRAGMFQQFPDTARLTLDLKKEMRHVVQTMPDRSIFALLVFDPENPVETIDPTPPPPGSLNVSLRGLTIVVDAGHGGHDSGAPGKQSYEKNHTLDIALRLRKELDRRGATVLMTRDADFFVTLQGRVDFANSRRADLFISCHIDSAPGSTATGTTTYYYSATSQAFAREVQNELCKASGLKSKGIIQRRLFVTRKTWMPSVLTESCYISNPREEKLLLDPNFRQRLANGMAQGIANYVARYGKPKR